MRKLYTFISGFVFSLVLLQAAKAQNDVTNLSSTATINNVSVENNLSQPLGNDYTDSCSADYNTLPVNSNPFGRYFVALPYNSSQKNPEQVCWFFGDGRDTCINYDPSNPPPNGYAVYHLYGQAGNYNVCVRIQYQGGCLAYHCRQLTIGDPDSCGANFQVLASTSNPRGKYFVAQPSHNHNKKPVQVCWNFGDNRDTCIQYPTSYTGAYAVYHLYDNSGNYNVCVTIHYDGGCEAHYCRIVEVGNSLDSCSANFQVISSTANQLNKYFVAQPWNNHNKKPIRVCWNFGDNRDTCINYPTSYTGAYAVNHIYSQPGNYNVCVTILYDGGCEAHYCRMVQVGEPDICGANFQVLAVSSTSLGKYFIAQPSHNHNKKPVRVCWQFGDNRDTCINYPTNYTGAYAVYHLYDSRGNYNVCVNILYDGGCEAHYCRIVQVGNLEDSCSANFQVVSTSANALNKYFIAQPWNNHNKKPVRVCWQFGDGRDTCIQYSTSYTGLYAVNHIYSQPDLYNVCVNILYDGGCEAHYCREVQVGEPDSCTADFERIQASITSLTAYFNALPWNNHNKKPSRVCWQFGDGRDTCINYSETFTGQYVVSHTYAQAGQYEVCVNILYFGGCESRKCKNIIVPIPPDTCSVQMFESTPSITSLNRSFYALPHSNNNRRVVTICWYFGDGRDTCINPDGINVIPIFYITHTYPGPGVYHPCVRVTFASGCIAEKCIETVIRSSADICGGYFTDSLIGPRTFRFHGQGIQNQNDHVISYNWSFSDGSSAAGQDVTHTFNQTTGTFSACLLIHTAQGCESHICRPLPTGSNVPTLQLSPNPVVTNLHVIFISTFTETVNIHIINSSGVTVRNYTKNAVIGSNVWDFDLTTLTPGIYSFVVQSPNQLASAIFLKQ